MSTKSTKISAQVFTEYQKLNLILGRSACTAEINTDHNALIGF